MREFDISWADLECVTITAADPALGVSTKPQQHTLTVEELLDLYWSIKKFSELHGLQ